MFFLFVFVGFNKSVRPVQYSKCARCVGVSFFQSKDPWNQLLWVSSHALPEVPKTLTVCFRPSLGEESRASASAIYFLRWKVGRCLLPQTGECFPPTNLATESVGFEVVGAFHQQQRSRLRHRGRVRCGHRVFELSVTACSPKRVVLLTGG